MKHGLKIVLGFKKKNARSVIFRVVNEEKNLFSLSLSLPGFIPLVIFLSFRLLHTKAAPSSFCVESYRFFFSYFVHFFLQFFNCCRGVIIIFTMINTKGIKKKKKFRYFGRVRRVWVVVSCYFISQFAAAVRRYTL